MSAGDAALGESLRLLQEDVIAIVKDERIPPGLREKRISITFRKHARTANLQRELEDLHRQQAIVTNRIIPHSPSKKRRDTESVSCCWSMVQWIGNFCIMLFVVAIAAILYTLLTFKSV